MAQQVNRRGWPPSVPTEIELVETVPLIHGHRNNAAQALPFQQHPQRPARSVSWNDSQNASHVLIRQLSLGGVGSSTHTRSSTASTASTCTTTTTSTASKQKKSLCWMLFVLWLKRHAPKRVASVVAICLSAWVILREPVVKLMGRRHHEQTQQYHQFVLPHQDRVVFVGKFGIGHRMAKLSAVYHLAHQVAMALPEQNMTHMEVRWGVCQNYPQDNNNKDSTQIPTTTFIMDQDTGGGPIFDFLFGTRFIPLATVLSSTTATATTTSIHKRVNPLQPHKELVVHNDCPRYYAGQTFKNSRLAIPSSFQLENDNPLFQKMTLDFHLFSWLEQQFTHQHSEATKFMLEHKFDSHTVVALHLRAGNGEQNHFVEANRGIANATAFVHNLVELLETLIVQLSRRTAPHRRKPWLLFVATDTPSLVATWPQTTQSKWQIPIRTVFFPQPQLPPNAGVTYSALEYGRPCLEAWKAMMVDTVVLGHADVLVAATRSTFTQAMPLSIVLGGGRQQSLPLWCPSTTTSNKSIPICPRFCEVSEMGTTMTCVQDRQAWLFRNTTNSWTLSPTKNEDTNSNTNNNADNDVTITNRVSSLVVHKVMVHFPDLDPEDKTPWTLARAVKFFQSPPNISTTDSNVEKLDWGKPLFNGGITINQKYRRKSKGYTSDWTFINESPEEGGT